MKVSEMIAALEAFKAEHGDLEVDSYSTWSGRYTHQGPVLDYRKVLTGRESKPDFWSQYSTKAAINKGEAVCRL